jgi:starvation-inducible DNA-binding protein
MEIITALKSLLANFWILFFDSRNAHWNIQSKTFMELHKFFQALYELAEDNADDIAERIRQLGDFTPIIMSDFVKLKTIQEVPVVLSDQDTAINHLL